ASGSTPIPLPAGSFTQGYGFGINDSGQGGGQTYSPSTGYVPFVGTASGTTNLNELVPVGWIIQTSIPTAINNKGQILAAGLDPNSVAHLVRLDPNCGQPTFTGPYPTSSSPQSTGTTTGWHMSY